MAIALAVLGVIVFIITAFGPRFYNFTSDHTIGTMIMGFVISLSLIASSMSLLTRGAT